MLVLCVPKQVQPRCPRKPFAMHDCMHIQCSSPISKAYVCDATEPVLPVRSVCFHWCRRTPEAVHPPKAYFESTCVQRPLSNACSTFGLSDALIVLQVHPQLQARLYPVLRADFEMIDMYRVRAELSWCSDPPGL